jgi:hypothetical protein
MKRVVYIFLMVFSGIFFMSSCTKNYLDRKNPATIGYEDVWTDASLLGLYVNGIYNNLPTGWFTTYPNIADEGRNNTLSGTPANILRGQWNEVNNPMDVWAGTYTQIRKCNEFLKNITSSPIDQPTKDKYTGEVKFLRAFFYFELVKRYGGVPLVTQVQSLTDSLLVKRNTLDECYNFVSKELTDAANLLPANADKARATKGAALAIKGHVLLHYASVLNNPTNELSRWQAAAAASKAVMDMGVYQLFPNVSKLWTDASNKESIFETQFRLPEKFHGWDSRLQILYFAHGNAGQCSPIQELVNAFPMKNGKSITDPASGYDPQNPYVGRDERFYASIGYNGGTMQGFTTKLETTTLRIYKGGRDYDSIPQYQIYNTITGYITLKGRDQNNTLYFNGNNSTQPWMHIRYAGVLLNYAEAQNEAVGPDASVYAALQSIRARAGITNPLPAGLSKDEMRNLIRNERYVELCFEDQRYWDLRRWKLAMTYLNGATYTAVVPTKNPDGSFTYQYNVPIPLTPVFEEKMYWMPIPLSETLKNGNLVQNPGWPG